MLCSKYNIFPYKKTIVNLRCRGSIADGGSMFAHHTGEAAVQGSYPASPPMILVRWRIIVYTHLK